MRAIPHVEYKTPEQIEAIASLRRKEAMSLAPGEARQSILREVTGLEQYAFMKRFLAPAAAPRAERPRER